MQQQADAREVVEETTPALVREDGDLFHESWPESVVQMNRSRGWVVAL
jgi:hypothetical protein